MPEYVTVKRLTDEEKASRRQKTIRTNRLKAAKMLPKLATVPSVYGAIGGGLTSGAAHPAISAFTQGLITVTPLTTAALLPAAAAGAGLGYMGGRKLKRIQGKLDRKEISQKEAERRSKSMLKRGAVYTLGAGTAIGTLGGMANQDYVNWRDQQLMSWMETGERPSLHTHTYIANRGGNLVADQYNKLYNWSAERAENRRSDWLTNNTRYARQHTGDLPPLKVTNWGERVRASRSTDLIHLDTTTRSLRPSVKIIGGAAAAGAIGYGGYQAYQHRDEIKRKAGEFGEGVSNIFHSTRHRLGA